MISKCYNATGRAGPIEENVMTVLSKRIVVRHVPIEIRICLDIQLVLGLHAKAAPSILVKMPMQRPSDAGKRNVSSKDMSMTEEEVVRIQILEDIPPKPLDIVAKN